MTKRPALFWTFGGLFSCYFFYLFYRAYAIPVTHDESVTSMLCDKNSVAHLLTYNYGYISGNNHILNSLSVEFFSAISGGFSALSVRFGNLLLGAIYLWAGLLFIFRFFQNNWVRALACTICISNPYAMEFFGLSRGYGMSMALESLAVLGAIKYFQDASDHPKEGRKRLSFAFLFAVLAVWANFATLLFYLYFLVAVSALMVYKRRKITAEWLIPLVSTAMCYAVCAIPMAKIKKAGDFGYFGNAGFWTDTVESFAGCALMGKQYFGSTTNTTLGVILVGMVIFAIIIALVQLFKRPKSPDQFLLLWLVLLLPGTLLVNVLVTKLNHTSWLNTRTTLLFYPLLVFSLLGLCKLVLNGQSRVQQWIIGASIAVILGHFIQVANITKVYEWAYDRDTYKVLNYVEKCYKEEGRKTPYSLYCYCFQHPSFQFHTWVSKSRYQNYVQEIQEVPRQVPDPINKEIDFYYIPKEQYPSFEPHYNILMELLGGELLLVRKK